VTSKCFFSLIVQSFEKDETLEVFLIRPTRKYRAFLSSTIVTLSLYLLLFNDISFFCAGMLEKNLKVGKKIKIRQNYNINK